MAGRFGNKTVQTVQTQPYGPAEPGLQKIVDQALANYNTGVGTEYPPFDTFAGLGDVSQQAISGAGEFAGMASPASAIYDASFQPSAAENYLTPTASGDYLTNTNPYLEDLISQGEEDIANRVRSIYLGKGRYGSNDFTDELVSGLGRFRTNILSDQYDKERARQMAAAGQIDQSTLARLGLGLGAGGMMSSDRLSGLDQLFRAGGVEDTAAQGEINADIARFLWEHGGSETAALDRLMQLVTPVAQAGQTTTVQEPRTPIRDALGFLAMAVSDRRAKTGIRRMGTTPGGLGLYRFRYRWGGPEQVGVMADEVAALQPDALGPMVSGLATVNLGRIR